MHLLETIYSGVDEERLTLYIECSYLHKKVRCEIGEYALKEKRVILCCTLIVSKKGVICFVCLWETNNSN